MLRLTKRQRAALGESIARLANFCVAGLIVVHFVGARQISLTVAVAGVIGWAGLMAIALALVGHDEVE